jgi:hypothetical protein
MLQIDNVLDPAFFELATKAKAIADAKTKEVSVFRDLYNRHKAKIAEFDLQVQTLVDAYKAAKTKDDPKQDDAQ